MARTLVPLKPADEKENLLVMTQFTLISQWQDSVDALLALLDDHLSLFQNTVCSRLDQLYAKLDGLVVQSVSPPVTALSGCDVEKAHERPTKKLKKATNVEREASPKNVQVEQNKSLGSNVCPFYHENNPICTTPRFSRPYTLKRHMTVHYNAIRNGGAEKPGFCKACEQFCPSYEAFVDHATVCKK